MRLLMSYRITKRRVAVAVIQKSPVDDTSKSRELRWSICMSISCQGHQSAGRPASEARWQRAYQVRRAIGDHNFKRNRIRVHLTPGHRPLDDVDSDEWTVGPLSSGQASVPTLSMQCRQWACTLHEILRLVRSIEESTAMWIGINDTV